MVAKHSTTIKKKEITGKAIHTFFFVRDKNSELCLVSGEEWTNGISTSTPNALLCRKSNIKKNGKLLCFFSLTYVLSHISSS